MAEFKINEFGEIIRDGVNAQPSDDKAEQDLYAEYTKLEYEIFTHPERWTVDELSNKKARFEILKQKLEIKKDDILAVARKKLQGKQDNSVLKQNIARFKKQND